MFFVIPSNCQIFSIHCWITFYEGIPNVCTRLPLTVELHTFQLMPVNHHLCFTCLHVVVAYIWVRVFSTSATRVEYFWIHVLSTSEYTCWVLPLHVLSTSEYTCWVLPPHVLSTSEYTCWVLPPHVCTTVPLWHVVWMEVIYPVLMKWISWPGRGGVRKRKGVEQG